MFCMDLRINSQFCPIQLSVIGFYNPDEKCLLRGTKCVFKWNALCLVLKELMWPRLYVIISQGYPRPVIVFGLAFFLVLHSQLLLGRQSCLFQRAFPTITLFAFNVSFVSAHLSYVSSLSSFHCPHDAT